MITQHRKRFYLLQSIFCTILAIGLSLSLTGVGLATGTARHYSGSAYFDSGYGAYAVLNETSADIFEVRISLQFAPNYTSNDDITSFQLILNDAQSINVPPDAQQPYEAPTNFSTTVQITGPITTIAVLPVREKGGVSDHGILRLSLDNSGWDAYIGTAAAVKNQKDSSRLNLRFAPHEDAEVFMQYYNGAPIQVTNILPGDWVAVTIGDALGGARGYMKAPYLAFGNDALSVQPAMPTYSATAEAFSLYTAPDSSSPILSSHGKGAKVMVLGLSKQWWHAQVDGMVGYVQIGAIEEGSHTNNPTSPSQPNSPNQPSAPQQPANPTAKLRTYSAHRSTDSGYIVDGVVTEVSPSQFIVNVNLSIPMGLNDVIIRYSLYINGIYTTAAEAATQGNAAPTRFKGTFAHSGSIDAIRLIPVLEKSGEHTNDDEFLNFNIK